MRSVRYQKKAYESSKNPLRVDFIENDIEQTTPKNARVGRLFPNNAGAEA